MLDSRQLLLTYYGLSAAALYVTSPGITTQDLGRVDAFKVTRNMLGGAIAQRGGLPVKEYIGLAIAHQGFEQVLRVAKPDWFSTQRAPVGKAALSIALGAAGYLLAGVLARSSETT